MTRPPLTHRQHRNARSPALATAGPSFIGNDSGAMQLTGCCWLSIVRIWSHGSVVGHSSGHAALQASFNKHRTVVPSFSSLSD